MDRTQAAIPPAGGAQGIRSTCPYRGVGCGVVALPDGRVVGDEAHPANRGRLCPRGATLAETLGAETLGTRGRLLRPRVDNEETGWEEALDRVADGFRAAINSHGPDSVAFHLSGQLLTEDYCVANKLMKGFIGSASTDTTRGCACVLRGRTRARLARTWCRDLRGLGRRGAGGLQQRLALPGHFQIMQQLEPFPAVRASDVRHDVGEQPADDGAADGG